jgi:hypothetical protein
LPGPIPGDGLRAVDLPREFARHRGVSAVEGEGLKGRAGDSVELPRFRELDRRRVRRTARRTRAWIPPLPTATAFHMVRIPRGVLISGSPGRTRTGSLSVSASSEGTGSPERPSRSGNDVQPVWRGTGPYRSYHKRKAGAAQALALEEERSSSKG